MTKIKYINELPDDGRAKFPKLLREVRSTALTAIAAGEAPQWGILKEYKNHASANDASNRLRNNNDDFAFATRAGVVYVKYVGDES